MAAPLPAEAARQLIKQLSGSARYALFQMANGQFEWRKMGHSRAGQRQTLDMLVKLGLVASYDAEGPAPGRANLTPRGLQLFEISTGRLP